MSYMWYRDTTSSTDNYTQSIPDEIYIVGITSMLKISPAGADLVSTTRLPPGIKKRKFYLNKYSDTLNQKNAFLKRRHL